MEEEIVGIDDINLSGEDDWPSDTFRQEVVRRLEPELTKTRLNQPNLPVPTDPNKVEVYVFEKATTKEQYVASMKKVFISLSYQNRQGSVEGEKEEVPKKDETDFPSNSFRKEIVHKLETEYAKSGVAQTLTPQQSEQQAFDAADGKDDYLAKVDERIKLLGQQPSPKPHIAMREKPIPGVEPTVTISVVEHRCSVKNAWRRVVRFFTFCVRSSASEQDQEDEKKNEKESDKKE